MSLASMTIYQSRSSWAIWKRESTALSCGWVEASLSGVKQAALNLISSCPAGTVTQVIPNKPEERTQKMTSMRKPRLLLVDDEIPFVANLLKLLSRRGYE